MDEFLRNARKHIGDVDLENMLGDIDVSKISTDQLKALDFGSGAGNLRRQLYHLELKKREEDAATQGFAVGIALGMIVGAVLAMIVAPRAGSETRGTVAWAVSDLRHRAGNLVPTRSDTAAADEDMELPVLPDEPAIERDFGTVDRPEGGA